MNMRRALAVALALLLVAPSALADLVHDLLAFSAPRPGVMLNMPEEPPPDDAPLDQLAGWWALNSQGDEMPSEKVRERLVEVIERRPDLVPSLVNYFPPRPDVCRAVEPAKENDTVAQWLFLNCASEREALAAAAANAHDDESDDVDGEEELVALAASDPHRAEPLLKQLAGSPQPNTRARAISLLFQHSDGFERGDCLYALQTIAADSQAPILARHYAIEALSAAKWDGRDEFLLHLFADDSFSDYDTYSVGATIAGADNDYWIPMFIKLLDSPNHTARIFAAQALGEFNLEYARADALEPLLPWLSNPDWIEDRGQVRLRIVQSVASLEMTGAIPGLLWVLDHDPDETMRSYAAEALASFHESRANDSMRRALEQMQDHDDRRRVIAALDANGGYSAIELARGLEAGVALALAREERADLMLFDATERFPTDAMIGFHVASDIDDRDDVARLVIRRAEEIRGEQPKLSEALLDVVQSWRVPAVNELLIEHLADGSASAEKVVAALERRELIRETSLRALNRLRAADGAMAGIVAVLAGDTGGERRILAGSDVEAQRGLLAAARLAGEKLSVDDVADLFGRTPLLDEAAEAFLRDEDSEVAGSLVRARHPNEIVIRGWGGDSEWEEEMMCRFHASGAAELIALKRDAIWIGDQTVVEIQVSGNGTPSPATTQDIVALVAASHFDELQPIEVPVYDGSEYEYLHLTRSGGRRVMIGNPMYAPGTPYEELVRRANALSPKVPPPPPPPDLVLREPLLLR
jgi:HEAT repeat protein